MIISIQNNLLEQEIIDKCLLECHNRVELLSLIFPVYTFHAKIVNGTFVIYNIEMNEKLLKLITNSIDDISFESLESGIPDFIGSDNYFDYMKRFLNFYIQKETALNHIPKSHKGYKYFTTLNNSDEFEVKIKLRDGSWKGAKMFICSGTYFSESFLEIYMIHTFHLYDYINFDQMMLEE